MQEHILAAEGWDAVTNMLNGVQGKVAAIGAIVLTIVLTILAIKISVKGKELREAFSELGKFGLAAILLGMAAMLPYTLTSLGTDIGKSSNSSPNPGNSVQGQ